MKGGRVKRTGKESKQQERGKGREVVLTEGRRTRKRGQCKGTGAGEQFGVQIEE